MGDPLHKLTIGIHSIISGRPRLKRTDFANILALIIAIYRLMRYIVRAQALRPYTRIKGDILPFKLQSDPTFIKT